MTKTVWIINQYASTPEYGYAGRHYYIGRELAKLGYKVYLITSASHHLLRKKPVLESAFRIERLGDFSVVWVRMPKYSGAHSKIRAFGWFFFSWRIGRLPKIIPDSPDVIVCSSPSLLSFIGAKWLARKFTARLVFEVRDIWPLTLTEIGGHSPAHPFIRMLQWVEDFAYRESDRVVSNLKNSVEHMESRGLDPRKFAWIPNGFSLDEWDLHAPLDPDVSRHLPEDRFLVGYTGTVGVANALNTLIEAAELLRATVGIVFVIVGAGKEKAELSSLVSTKKLNNVHFVEPIPKVQVQAMLEKFDACYLGWLDDPLYEFGIGANKIPEYLYSGRPVLHAFSGACDPIQEANAGITVPAEDSQKLAEAVLKLYNMAQEEREALGNNGRVEALAHYEYSELAKQFRDVLFPDEVI